MCVCVCVCACVRACAHPITHTHTKTLVAQGIFTPSFISVIDHQISHSVDTDSYLKDVCVCVRERERERHSEHRFPASSLWEGCRKPVLGVCV